MLFNERIVHNNSSAGAKSGHVRVRVKCFGTHIRNFNCTDGNIELTSYSFNANINLIVSWNYVGILISCLKHVIICQDRMQDDWHKNSLECNVA
jgi:hypothetical protein